MGHRVQTRQQQQQQKHDGRIQDWKLMCACGADVFDVFTECN